ncbi:MAG: hypothetical protein JSR36_06195 [Proteobacteria bacterium]|nr:hypothetical protein [Pseudomonadota bacterium]
MTSPSTVSGAPLYMGVRWPIVLIAGLLAGALDLTFAFIFYSYQGATPDSILRGIASGLVGREAAHANGNGPVVLGAFLHFFISVCAALVFYLASRRLPLLVRRPLLSGAIFGVLVYLFMHLVVIPLSRIPFRVPSVHNVVGELGSHIFLFGMIIATGVARARRVLS